MVLDVNGKEKETDEVFYAGVFADPEFKHLSDAVENNILKLDMNGGSYASATTTVMLPIAGESITLYVTEVDEKGNPVADSEDFMYDVTVANSTITISEEELSAETKITNQEKEEVKETETPKKEDKKSEKETGVKTGDDTPVLPYATGAGVSMLAMIWVAVYDLKRRKHNNR